MDRFDKLIKMIFEFEELREPEYDKTLFENGLDSLGVISFTFYFHEEYKDIDVCFFDDINLVKLTINELKGLVNACNSSTI